MKNLSIERLDEGNLQEDRVDMNEVQLWGAMLMLTKALNDNPYSDEHFTIEEVDGDTYYANRYLEVAGNGYLTNDSDGKLIRLSSVFVRKSGNILFGVAEEVDEATLEGTDESFIIRID